MPTKACQGLATTVWLCGALFCLPTCTTASQGGWHALGEDWQAKEVAQLEGCEEGVEGAYSQASDYFVLDLCSPSDGEYRFKAYSLFSLDPLGGFTPTLEPGLLFGPFILNSSKPTVLMMVSRGLGEVGSTAAEIRDIVGQKSSHMEIELGPEERVSAVSYDDVGQCLIVDLARDLQSKFRSVIVPSGFFLSDHDLLDLSLENAEQLSIRRGLRERLVSCSTVASELRYAVITHDGVGEFTTDPTLTIYADNSGVPIAALKTQFHSALGFGRGAFHFLETADTLVSVDLGGVIKRLKLDRGWEWISADPQTLSGLALFRHSTGDWRIARVRCSAEACAVGDVELQGHTLDTTFYFQVSSQLSCRYLAKLYGVVRSEVEPEWPSPMSRTNGFLLMRNC